MMDDSVNSFVNINLRKTDMESYIFGQEGNLWNNIIFKVCREKGKERKDNPRWIKFTWTAARATPALKCSSCVSSPNW